MEFASAIETSEARARVALSSEHEKSRQRREIEQSFLARLKGKRSEQKRAKEIGIIRFCQYLISPGRGLTKNGSYASGITLGENA